MPKQQRLTMVWTAFYALVLNALWEFGQCSFFYDMSGVGIFAGVLRMVIAIVADVLIVLTLVYVSQLLTRGRFLFAPKLKHWVILLALSFVASVALEWSARFYDRWEYGRFMPVFYLAGVSVGLLPVAQITLLPTLSCLLARHNSKGGEVSS
jgi:hypothetical protein